MIVIMESWCDDAFNPLYAEFNLKKPKAFSATFQNESKDYSYSAFNFSWDHYAVSGHCSCRPANIGFPVQEYLADFRVYWV
jgi:hypothetical protein